MFICNCAFQISLLLLCAACASTTTKQQKVVVSCGGHLADSCADCGPDWTWCNGDCTWLNHEQVCVSKDKANLSLEKKNDNNKRLCENPWTRLLSKGQHFSCDVDRSCGLGGVAESFDHNEWYRVGQAALPGFSSQRMDKRDVLHSSPPQSSQTQHTPWYFQHLPWPEEQVTVTNKESSKCGSGAKISQASTSSAEPSVFYPSETIPGKARVIINYDSAEVAKEVGLVNDVMEIIWNVKHGVLLDHILHQYDEVMTDVQPLRHTVKKVQLDDKGFSIAYTVTETSKNGYENKKVECFASSSQFFVNPESVKQVKLSKNYNASKRSIQYAGWRLQMTLSPLNIEDGSSDEFDYCLQVLESTHTNILWWVELRDDSNYVRQGISVVQHKQQKQSDHFNPLPTLVVDTMVLLRASVYGFELMFTNHTCHETEQLQRQTGKKSIPKWSTAPPPSFVATHSHKIDDHNQWMGRSVVNDMKKLAGLVLDGGVASLSPTTFVGIEHPVSINMAYVNQNVMPTQLMEDKDVVESNWEVLCGRTGLSAEFEVKQAHTVSCDNSSWPCWTSQTLAQATLIVGIAPHISQVRRAFLYYLDRERAQPARINVHYNTWYDLAAGSTYNQQALLGAIRAFRVELMEKRGVSLDNFLADDGWDNRTHGLWRTHRGWPDGFKNVTSEAKAAGGALGLWLSPWGGYGGRSDRVRAAQAEGIQTMVNGKHATLTLADNKYFKRFREVLVELVGLHNITLLKLDGIGNIATGRADPHVFKDFEAMIALLSELRALFPNLWINLSTGTWPSPFWLHHADCVWRRGHDHFFSEGEAPVKNLNAASIEDVLRGRFGRRGPPRERWMNYRDAQTFQNIFRSSPLFPLSSLMTHGVIYARHAWDLNLPHQGLHFINEIRSAVGSGTMLQELYLTYSFLSDTEWDAVAESITWARHRESILVDTHWVGGDPSAGKVYGWAAWRQASFKTSIRTNNINEKEHVYGNETCSSSIKDNPYSKHTCTLTLRNPSDHSMPIRLEATEIFELPPHARILPQHVDQCDKSMYYIMHSVYEDQRLRMLQLVVGEVKTIWLGPYEVLTFQGFNTVMNK